MTTATMTIARPTPAYLRISRVISGRLHDAEDGFHRVVGRLNLALSEYVGFQAALALVAVAGQRGKNRRPVEQLAIGG